MNLTKKLIFGLLLAGALFTTACGSDSKKAGDACEKDADCASEACVSKVCVDKCNDQGKCSDDTKECKKGTQLTDTTKTADVCLAKTAGGSGNDKENGTDCTKDAECKSKFCDLGNGATNKCKDAPGDASVDGEHHCTDSKQCKDSASSLKGLCMDASAFGMSTICTYECTAATECSNIESSLTCGDVTPAGGGAKVKGCTVGAPTTKLANGEACTKSKECQSDVCDVNTEKCVAPAMPKSCTSTSDCTAKEVCGVFMSGSMKICTPKCDADPDICPTKYPCGEVTTADSPSTKVQACSTSH